MTLEKFLTNEKDNCPFSFKIKNVSKPLKTFIKTRINGNIGDSLSAQDLVSIYLARNSSDRIPERDFQN
ncbi:hypothetical protein IJM86_04195 [bacterium]|nr:hypothetical protein [bacterium]